MLLGYARVSAKEQDLNIQIYALLKIGCKKVFQEKVTGIKNSRSEFDKLLQQIQTGDTLVVYSLERLGLSIKQFAHLLNEFKYKGVNFKSISEGVFDTTTQIGESLFQIVTILTELEANFLSERTMIGLEEARRRGSNGGRKFDSYNKVKASAAILLYQNGDPISYILKKLQIGRSTLYEYLKKEGIEHKSKDSG